MSNQYITKKNKSYSLPQEIKHLFTNNYPLYVLIAMWACRRSEPVTVRDVRVAFGLTMRRASDMMEYISEHAGKDIDVQCSVNYLSSSDRRLRRSWQITRVSHALKTTSRKSESKTNTVAYSSYIPENDATRMKRWFLRRLPGTKYEK